VNAWWKEILPSRQVARMLIAILCFSISGFTAPNASAAGTTVRSLVDRPDDVTGYQIHLVYVALKSSVDKNWDTNGQIDSWVTEANNWLMGKVGHKFVFDTYQGSADVSFLQSKYTSEELCKDSCEGLDKLQNEYYGQDNSYNGSKTLLFVIYDKLPGESCGWATRPSNQALIHNLGSDSCGGYASDKTRFGLPYPSVSLLHELIHTYGISHKCFDSSDLMLGSPECPGSRGETSITFDASRSHYVGGSSSDGIDLLKMPIWADNSGSSSYAKIQQISDNKFVPQLKDDTVYAVIGQQSKKFDWEWEKNFNPDGAGLNCRFDSGVVSIVGTQNKSACLFNVPSNLRPGGTFTVTQSWVIGPWHGEATVSGVLVRADLTSNPCTENSCFVGGSTTADYSCWTSDVKSMTLQQLVNGKWSDFKTVQTKSGSKCVNSGKHINYPELTLNFQQPGLFIYRWFVPSRPGWNSFKDTPFAIIVNDENSAEPSKDEVASAQIKAIDLGKVADGVKVSSSVNSSITCIKGTLIRVISGTNPRCPTGFKKK